MTQRAKTPAELHDAAGLGSSGMTRQGCARAVHYEQTVRGRRAWPAAIVYRGTNGAQGGIKLMRIDPVSTVARNRTRVPVYLEELVR